MTIINETMVSSSAQDKVSNTVSSLRNMLADKNAANVWGKGFVFDTEDDALREFFEKYDQKYKLIHMFSTAERNMSRSGRSIIVMNKMNNGEVTLNLALPHFFNGVAKIFTAPNVAVIYQRVTLDQGLRIVKSVYTDKFVRHQMFGQDQNKQIIIMQGETQELAQLGLKPFWYHNLGFCPVFDMFNQPHQAQYWTSVNFPELADWYNAQIWETKIIHALENLVKELYLNHSRVIMSTPSQRIVQQLQTMFSNSSYGELTSQFVSDFLIDGGTDVGANVRIQPASGDFNQYMQVIEALLDNYMKFAHSSKMSEGGGAQKTAAETGNTRANLMEFLAMKIKMRTMDITDMLEKLFIANGFPNPEFYFKIIGNTVLDETTLTDNLNKDVMIGAITPVDYMVIKYNISPREAREKYQANRKFNADNQLMTNIDALDFDSIGQFNGRGGAPEKEQHDDEDVGGKDD